MCGKKEISGRRWKRCKRFPQNSGFSFFRVCPIFYLLWLLYFDKGDRNSMTKDVLVSVQGIQISNQEESAEPVEVITAGAIILKKMKSIM